MVASSYGACMLILFLPAKTMEQQHKEKELRCNAAV
jgi:hypothetical protein